MAQHDVQHSTSAAPKPAAFTFWARCVSPNATVSRHACSISQCAMCSVLQFKLGLKPCNLEKRCGMGTIMALDILPLRNNSDHLLGMFNHSSQFSASFHSRYFILKYFIVQSREDFMAKLNAISIGICHKSFTCATNIFEQKTTVDWRRQWMNRYIGGSGSPCTAVARVGDSRKNWWTQ